MFSLAYQHFHYNGGFFPPPSPSPVPKSLVLGLTGIEVASMPRNKSLVQFLFRVLLSLAPCDFAFACLQVRSSVYVNWNRMMDDAWWLCGRCKFLTEVNIDLFQLLFVSPVSVTLRLFVRVSCSALFTLSLSFTVSVSLTDHVRVVYGRNIGMELRWFFYFFALPHFSIRFIKPYDISLLGNHFICQVSNR